MLSLILRLPEMRQTFARNRLASRLMGRYNKQRCEFLGPSAIDEGDILLSLILRLPEMRQTFARNRLASRLMGRYNKQRCEFLGPSAILVEYT